MTEADASVGHQTEELPEGWRQAYYSTETVEDTYDSGAEYTFVTAVYEHVPLNLKQVVLPDCTPEGARGQEHTWHEAYFIYPVYEDLGIPMSLSAEFNNLEWAIRSIIPEVKSRDGEPNVNDGPYATYDGDRPRRMFSGPRSTEEQFDWSRLPKDAVDALRTFKQYPLDYSPVVEDIQHLGEADTIATTEPGLLPDPYPVAITVHESDREEENFLWTTPMCSKRVWENQIDPLFDTEAVNLDEYEDGDELATVYVEFQRETFPSDPRVRHVRVPEDEPLPLYDHLREESLPLTEKMRRIGQRAIDAVR